MIYHIQTYYTYGYWPEDLKHQSARPIIAACNGCGKVRIIQKRKYRDLCLQCANKKRGENLIKREKQPQKTITTRKTKHLNSITIDHITINTRCFYNLNTHSIKIYNTFFQSTNYTGGTKTNKKCASWLGDRTETILMSMFDNVERMPINNPGYDFICGKGYKIDAKSSCIKKKKKEIHSDGWLFSINKNTTADYFLCLALDNRNDLNPLHVWLIPGEVLNGQFTVNISKSTLDKWFKYELSLDKVLSCCNIMKNE